MNDRPIPNASHIPVLLAMMVIWIGFALRVAGIDLQSIWYDEGLSIFYSQGALTEILANVSQSDHPPLHSLLLHCWIRACGDSAFSVRLMSAWWGTLSLALVWRLGKRLSPAIGALSALLLALSPFAIWFSQETRGYTLGLSLIIALIDVAWDLRLGPSLSPPRPPRRTFLGYAGYALLAAAALYSHFYSGFVLLALNLSFGIDLVRPHRSVARSSVGRQLGCWAAAQLLALALFVPWLPFVTTQLQENATYWHGAVGWRQIVRQTLYAFSAGTAETTWTLPASIAFLVLLSVGSTTLYRRRSTRRWPHWLWLWILIPLLAQIGINRSIPKFAPRYLLYSLPAYLLLAAAGLEGLFRAAGRRAFRLTGWVAALSLLAATSVIGGATARALGRHYFDESLYRPDFRAVAGYIQSQAEPDDVIVLVSGYSYPAFTFYYRGPLAVVPLPDNLLPTTRQPIDLHVLQTLDQAIAGHDRLWLILWQPEVADPTGLITDELQHTYRRLGVGQTFHDVALLLFDTHPGPLLSAQAQPAFPSAADFGSIGLTGYDLPTRSVKPGDTLYLYLYWETHAPMQHDYKVFAHLLDSDQQIVAQRDKVAGADEYPTSHWPPGSIVRDRLMLTLPANLPAGRYPLIVGLYRPDPDAPRLPVVGKGAFGNYVLLAEIDVQGSPR